MTGKKATKKTTRDTVAAAKPVKKPKQKTTKKIEKKPGKTPEKKTGKKTGKIPEKIPEKKPEKRRGLLGRFIKFLVVVLILAALPLLLLHSLVDLFEVEITGYLAEKLSEKSGNRYRVTYDYIDLNLLGGGIHALNLAIKPEPGALKEPVTGTLVRAEVPELKIEGISLWSLFSDNPLSVREIMLKNAEIEITRGTQKGGKKARERVKEKERAKARESADPGATPDKENPRKPIHVGDLILRNTSFRLNAPGKAGKQEVRLDVPQFYVHLSGLKIFPYFSLSSGDALLRKVTYRFPDGFYTLKAKRLRFSRPTSTFTLDFLRLFPNYPRYEFSRRKGRRTSRMSLRVRQIRVDDLAFQGLLKRQEIGGSLIALEEPRLEIFRSKAMPRGSRRKRPHFPQQLLRGLKILLNIGEFRVKDGALSYAEHPEGQKALAKVFFTGIKGNIKNITNDPERIRERAACTLSASAKVMGRSWLRVKMNLPLNSLGNRFYLSGSLGKLDMRVFNSMLRPNARVRVDRGTVDRLHFKMEGDNRESRGEMHLHYHDLKVAMLRGDRRKKRRFMSFLANTVILNSNPRNGKAPRVGKIKFKRDQSVPFFKYIWKSLLSGLKPSLGL